MTFFYDTPRVVKPGLEIAPTEHGVMLLAAVPGKPHPVGIELSVDQATTLVDAIVTGLRDASDGPIAKVVLA